MDLYGILGVNKAASQEEIKSAYREKAKKHHPDKGGDPEKFRQAQIAYDTLSDDQKKSDYDQGKTAQPDDPALTFLSSLFFKVISENEEVEKVDLFKLIHKDINGKLYSLYVDKKNLKRQIKKLNKIRKRIKKDDRSFFIGLTDAQIRNNEHVIEQIEIAEKVAARSLEYLLTCEYDTLVQQALEAAIKP